MGKREVPWYIVEYGRLSRAVKRLRRDLRTPGEDEACLEYYRERLTWCRSALDRFNENAASREFGAESREYEDLSAGLIARTRKLERDLKQGERLAGF